MISNHWKIERGLEKEANVRNSPNFRNRKGIVTINIKNKRLIPEWAESKTKILINGYAEERKDSECVIESGEGDFNFLNIGKDSIIINNFDKIIENLVYEQYYKIKRPFYTRLPFDYTRIPVPLRNFLFNALLTFKRDPKWPNWPVEKSVELIRYLYIKSISIKLKKKVPYVSFWPQKKKFAVVITHDCDTESSFKNIDKIRDIEKRYGMLSCWNILSNKYKIDKNALKRLKNEGCEIGLHGYNHDNRLPFLKKEKIIGRINSASSLIKEFSIRGFRSPSLLRNKKFLELLSNYFAYDSSTCDTDLLSPVAIRSGTCTVFPFFINNMVEIPITLPQDYRLIRLNKTKNEIFDIWKGKIDFLRKVNGTAVLLTHPDSHIFGNDKYLDVYEKTLKYMTSFEEGWHALPNEICKWWNERDRASIKKGKILNSKRAIIEHMG